MLKLFSKLNIMIVFFCMAFNVMLVSGNAVLFALPEVVFMVILLKIGLQRTVHFNQRITLFIPHNI